MTGGLDRLRQVAELTRSVSSALDLESVLAKAVAAVSALRPDSVCAVRLLDHAAGGYRLLATTHPQMEAAVPALLPLGVGLTHLVAVGRQPLLVSDARSHPDAHRASWDAYPAVGIYYGTPVAAGGELLGVLNVGFPTGAPPSEEERAAIDLLADHASIAIRNAQLLGESERQRRVAHALAGLGRILVEGLHQEAAGARIAELTRVLLRAPSAVLFRLEPETEALVSLGIAGELTEAFGTEFVLPRGTGAAGLAVVERRCVCTSDLFSDPRLTLVPATQATLERIAFRSVIAVPLLAQGRVIGALAAGDLPGRLYTEEEQELIQRFADEAALAIENARLAEEARLSQEEAEKLAQVARTVSETLDMATVSDRIVQSLLALFRVPASYIRLARPDGSLEVVAWAGAIPHFNVGHVLAPGEGISGRVVAEGRTLSSTDILRESGNPYSEETRRRIEAAGIGSTLTAPLRVKGAIIGVLSLADRRHRVFTEREADLLGAFADQAGLAIENARLYEALTVRASRLHTLARVNRLVSSSLDLDEALGGIARAAAELTAAPVAAFWIADEEARTLRLAAYSDEELGADYPLRSVRYDQSVVGLIATYRRAVNMPDVFAGNHVVAVDWWRAHELSSLFGIPIVYQGRLLGVLSLAGRRPFDFTADDRDLLDTFVAQAAVAIWNARLYEQVELQRRELLAEAIFLRAQSEVARVALSTLNTEELLPALLATICRVQGYRYGHFWRPTEDGREITIVAAAGKDAEGALGVRQALADPTSLVACTMGDGCAAFANRIAETPPAHHNLAKSLGAQALLSLPVHDRTGAVIGALVFGDSDVPDRFGERDVTQGVVLAGQVAQAIENAALFGRITRGERALRARAEQQAAVAELSQHVLGGRDPGALMDQAVGLLARTLDVEFAKVLELHADGESFVVRAGVGWNPGTVGRAVSAGSDSQAGYTLLARAPVVVEDLATDARFSGPTLLREHGVVSGITVIIHGTERPFGVLGAHTARARAFTRDDVHFLQALANVLATALQRAGVERALRESEERLRQSQKMEAVGRLAGGVAHDFNNLLTIILGRVEMLTARLAPGDAAARDLELIETTSQRAAALTRQLLAFSRKQLLAPKVLDLNAVVFETERMLDRLIGENIDLILMPSREPALVHADPNQLQQVLLNLAVNARDAMRTGGRLVIATGYADVGDEGARDGKVGAGRWVTLTVSDTGVGMDEETRAHVFEPFFTTKRGSGTGLGLSTVYGIVTQSGGHIDVDSEPGHGTRFSIYLPRVEGVADPSAPVPVQAELPAGTETILLVEDEERVRELAREILETRGFEVLEARHGAEALGLAERHAGPIHLLLADVVMPRMSGPEVARRLGELRPATKVAYISGYALEVVTAHGMSAAEVPLLQKPFTAGALLRKVREVLDA